MALLHHATVTPPKIDLLHAWVPLQPWAAGIDVGALDAVGAFRLDDPANVVGMETHLLRTLNGHVLQVPWTYRSSPLLGAERALVGTLQHSVLGQRFVYDAPADPVYVATLAATILGGGREADQFFDSEKGPEPRPLTTFVRGSGATSYEAPPVDAVAFDTEGHATTIYVGAVTMHLHRDVELGPVTAPGEGDTLVGRWPGHDEWALLATASVTSS